MARVGITGLTGMIGRNFLDWFRDAPEAAGSLELVALSRQSRPADFLQGIPCRRIDFADPGSFRGTLEDLDAVVHLAGLARSSDPRAFYRANRDGMAVLLEALARHGPGVRHLLFASSQTAVGPVPEGQEATDEDSPCRPISHYGASKLAAEQVLRQAPLPWTILRLPAVWGRYDPDGLNILKTARGGLLPVIGGREAVLSYIFAQDLAPLLPRMILNERLYGGVFNAGYDRPVRAGRVLPGGAPAAGAAPAPADPAPAPVDRLPGHGRRWRWSAAWPAATPPPRRTRCGSSWPAAGCRATCG